LVARKIGLVLQEILAAMEGIEAAIAGKTFADFQREWLLRQARNGVLASSIGRTEHDEL
jgi:hypothetical protein